MIPQDLHYLFPAALYLIPIGLIIFILYCLFKNYRSHVLQEYAAKKNLATLLDGERTWIYWLRVSILTLAWIFACLALMQPLGGGQDATSGKTTVQGLKKRKLHDVIFLVDASASMGIKDGRNGTTRLEEAKEIADQILFRLDGQQAAAYAFTGEPIQLSPPTFDLFFVRSVIQNIALREGGNSGTNFQSILETIHKKFLEVPKSKLRTIILISDGGDTRIEGLNGSEKTSAIDKLEQLVKEKNTRLFTIGVGTLEGGKVPDVLHEGQAVTETLHPDILRSLAERNRGSFYSSNNVSVKAIADDIIRIMNMDNPYLAEGEQTTAKNEWVYSHYFQIPLLISIILLLIGLLFPNRLKMTLLSMLVVMPLLGSSEDLDLAQQWYEAGVYERSMDVYRELMASPLSNWEEMVVRYNIGTVLVADQEWANAAASFRSLPITENPSPWLQRLTHTNMAHGRLREALLTTDLPKKVFLLRQALVQIEAAKKWDCKLRKIIGYQDCPDAYDLEQMQAVTENNQSDSLIHIQRYRIEHAGFLNGIPLLLSQVETALENLKFLKEKVEDTALRDDYQKVFLSEAETWMPLWEQVKNRVDPPPLFLSARKSYLYSQMLIKDNEYDEAQSYLEDAIKQLKEVMQDEFGSVKEIELLQSLQNSYQQVLLQEPIQLITLASLLREQQQIAKVIGTELMPSTRSLTEALVLLGEGKQNEAQLKIEIAFDAVRVLIKHYGTVPTTVNILEDAIESQQHAVNLARLLEGSFNPLGKEQLQDAQKQVLEVVDPFIAQVAKEQQIEFEELGKCAEKPWDTAVISYYNGLQAARTALISEDPIKWQEKALAYWQEALEELKIEPTQEEEKKEDKAVNQLFQDLQQMEQMDVKPEAPITPAVGEAKPW